jgi:hypothetical protein
MSEEKEEDLTFDYFNASRKAQWLKGHFRDSFYEAKVIAFMNQHPIKFEYHGAEVQKFVSECKRKLKLSDSAMVHAFDMMEKTIKYFSLMERDSYHPILKDAFGGLIVPKIITQLFLESNDYQKNEEMLMISQLEGDFNFQVGEFIEISMFPDILPQGKYLVK